MIDHYHPNYDFNDPAVVSAIDELPLWSAPFGLWLLDVVTMKPGMQVLDIGCGSGFPLLELANRLGPSCRLFGIDPWEALLNRLQEKMKVNRLDNVTLIQDKAENMTFEDESFDLIVSNNGINNVESPKTVLASCYRMAKPGAQVVLTVNLPETMIEFYQVYELLLKEQEHHEAIEKLHHHIRHKRKPLKENLNMISNAGFRIDDVHQDQFTIRCLDGSAMFQHFLIQLAFIDSWTTILPSEFVDDIFAELEQRLNALAAKKGELRLSVPWVCINSHRA